MTRAGAACEETKDSGEHDARRFETVGRALKLVVERAWPHRIVGVHIFGPDACELIHYGTTLVQALHTTYSRAIARSTRTMSATPAGA